MDLKHLERFVAVADAGAFNKAARRLFSSPPVLTRSVQLLEEGLEVQLLERGPSGVTLTNHGRELLPWARQLVNDHQRMRQALEATRGATRPRLTVGLTSSFLVQVMPEAIGQTLRRFPNVEIRVVEGCFPSMLDRLREGELDLAIGARNPALDLDGLLFEPLIEERFGVATRIDRLPHLGASVCLADLSAERWILPDEPELIRYWTAAFLRDDVTPPPVSVRTYSRALTTQLLEEGDFVAMVGELAFEDEVAQGRLRLMYLPSSTFMPAGLFVRQSAETTMVALTLAKAVRQGYAALQKQRCDAQSARAPGIAYNRSNI